MPTLVRAPFAGRVIAPEDVPDPVFAQSIVGAGLALDPVGDADVAVLAPCDGRIVKIHPHAVVVAVGAHAVLVHLGLDTVELHGEGFTVLAGDGDEVAAGGHLLTWSPAAVRAGGRSAVSPVVAMQADAAALEARVAPGDTVDAGALMFTWP
ncbi:sugar-specific permease EIIA 1 domain protein [Beutenbergia cavernae DSM 12333]|uniref:Sugar-specific permease EIIA 1 domain protein n=1 Tax=Beutenbergia cavernae (strain ATCC BAA-8 / DSM 12333 / CCUG 43141 / JCM 11478 / NBRC 16432 / NCIMB 13614 / HKI 0122) TaxID=471853 RepID=C5BXJ4_BEUC1|nr:PTS glucose transporter subunit IIA [Beutenbergia cavernae]ACQ80877.1 sugar-specific permease EIIA 1 domain protein [Beutenbergia cavernae DSM 12333]